MGETIADAIASIIKPRPPVPRGTYLFHQGAPMTGYYFLRSGSAKAIFDDGNGSESVMGFLLPTDLIGAGSMQQPVYYDSVVTLERSAFCVVSTEDLTALCRENPAIQDSFLSKITDRIQTERHARIRLDHTTAEQRLADFILELSERMHRLGRDRDVLYLSMSRSDIGTYLGLASETVSRALRRFADAGAISVRVKQLQIIDRARLREIVHNPAAAKNLH
jgi:CRP/FNR family transcriptional regulator